MKTVKVAFCGNFWMKSKIIALMSDKYNFVESAQPDFVFWNYGKMDFLKYMPRPAYPFIKKQPILINFYTENIFPDFNIMDYAIGFHDFDLGERNLYVPYFWWADRKEFDEIAAQKNSDLSDDFVNRRFCNFVYSNLASGNGTQLRNEFAKKLMEYKQVDCPGEILNNMSNDEISGRASGDWRKSKIDFIGKYKFTIAFENSNTVGYSTEKIIQPLVAHSVPIYWGDESVCRYINPKSFINAAAFATIDDLVNEVKRLDNDDAAYMEMLRAQPVINPIDFAEYDKKIVDFISYIFENGRIFRTGRIISPVWQMWEKAFWRGKKFFMKLICGFIPGGKNRHRFQSWFRERF
jgi:hypothetical protein